MLQRLATALFGFVIVVGIGVAAAAVLPPGGSFGDDDDSVHEPNIEAIAAEGITQGCNPPTNDLYCPDKSVTRAQMATFLTRALNLPPATGSFTDTDGSVHEANIGALAGAGITVGCNPPINDMFCPDKAVTRAQMATFLTRALSLSPAVGTFTDTAGSVHEASIGALAAAGITVGCNPPVNDKFCPDKAVTRAQMATFLTRALGLTPIVPPPAPVVLLDADGVGGVEFGASAVNVENALEGWLGSPSSDTGSYLDPCTGVGMRREVRWDALTIYFWNGVFEGWSLDEHDGPIPSPVLVDGDWSFTTTWAELEAAGATYDELWRFWELGHYRGRVEYSVPLRGDALLTYIGAGYGAYLHGC